ncbi:TlpA disulfide reductase family protein [Nonomuraea sp. NPDC050680]|uniref:TlpA family protein disulfide reductase n=1 Tax=Nonomuraea sp. NPDC050680 TaxID=3154630 RepID=UPI0033C7C6BD
MTVALLAASVVLVGILCLLNLVLVLALAKRVRDLATAVAQARHTGTVRGGFLAVGETVGEFTARTVDGGELTRDALTGGAVVGFFSTSCGGCREMIPVFVEHARDLRDQGRLALAVVVAAERDDPTSYVEPLAQVARVVVEGHEGLLGSAFKVGAFPAFCVIGGHARVGAVSADPGEVVHAHVAASSGKAGA